MRKRGREKGEGERRIRGRMETERRRERIKEEEEGGGEEEEEVEESTSGEKKISTEEHDTKVGKYSENSNSQI